MEQSIQGPSRIFGRQPLKKLKRYGLLKQTIFLQIFKGCLPQILLGPFLNNLSHMSSTSEYFSPANCTIYNNLVFVKYTKAELTATQLALTYLYFKVVFAI